MLELVQTGFTEGLTDDHASGCWNAKVAGESGGSVNGSHEVSSLSGVITVWSASIGTAVTSSRPSREGVHRSDASFRR
jgi:hypothetical protein